MDKRWTIKLPNIPGYYWLRSYGTKARLVVVAPALNHDGNVRFRVYHIPHPEDKELPYDHLSSSDPLLAFQDGMAEWWGPLNVPPTQDRKGG